jgi:hypothetical protein
MKAMIEKESSDYYWESFLADYRTWLKGVVKDSKQLRFYPLIFWLHIVLILFLLYLALSQYGIDLPDSHSELTAGNISFLWFQLFCILQIRGICLPSGIPYVLVPLLNFST